MSNKTIYFTSLSRFATLQFLIDRRTPLCYVMQLINLTKFIKHFIKLQKFQALQKQRLPRSFKNHVSAASVVLWPRSLRFPFSHAKSKMCVTYPKFWVAGHACIVGTPAATSVIRTVDATQHRDRLCRAANKK